MRYDESIIIRGVPILTSLKLRNIMSNEIQNFNIIVLCQLWNHEYKEPTIWECLIEPRIKVLSQYIEHVEVLLTILIY